METNLCVAGFGGQGVMTLGKFLADATCNSTDKNVTFFPSYGAEQRGGTANCSVCLSDDPIGSPLVLAPDVLVAMNQPSLDKFEASVAEGGIVVADSTLVQRIPDIECSRSPAVQRFRRVRRLRRPDLPLQQTFLCGKKLHRFRRYLPVL